MKIFGLTNCVLSISIATVLGGCSVSQVPIARTSAVSFTAEVSPLAASASYLYVSNTANVKYPVDIFLRSDPSKGIVGHIGQIVFPQSLSFDSRGTLYVSAWYGGVWAYKANAHKPFRVYTGAKCAADAVASEGGTVYVADACRSPDGHTGAVLVYAPGQSKPSRYLRPGGSPYALAVDANEDLYVGYNNFRSYWGQVKRYRAGASLGDSLLPEHSTVFITGVAIDKHGALLVANNGVIDVFTAKDQPPSRVIHTGQGHVDTIAFDHRGNTLYVTSGCVVEDESSVPMPESSSGCGKRPDTVVALDYATGERLWTLRQKNWVPVGIAVWPTF